MRRAIRIVVHNWPLKLAAIALATLLYAGLVVSQGVQLWTGRVQIVPQNQPSSAFIVGNLGAVTNIRYFAPRDVADRMSSAGFTAYVDFNEAASQRQGPFVRLTVHVIPSDTRVRVVDFDPPQIQVQLDPLVSKDVPVEVDRGTVPAGLQVRDPILDTSEVTVSGPQSYVSQVSRAVARVLIQPSGISIDQSVDLEAVDGRGEPVTQVKIEPAAVRVKILVGNQLGSKALPVNPVVVGTPAAGYEIGSVTVSPAVASIEGEADALASLVRVDTSPLLVSGASADVSETIGLVLPDGTSALSGSSVRVTIQLRPTTGTRTIQVGVVLTGTNLERTYSISTDSVDVTIGGPVAALDALDGSTLAATADASDLGPGAHQVGMRISLPPGLTLVAISPAQVIVGVGVAATPVPTESTAGPTPTPSVP